MKHALIFLHCWRFRPLRGRSRPMIAIETALSAAPANLRQAATVIKWKPDFTYDTVKQGTNRLVCYDRSGFPGQRKFSIECTSVANLPASRRT